MYEVAVRGTTDRLAEYFLWCLNTIPDTNWVALTGNDRFLMGVGKAWRRKLDHLTALASKIGEPPNVEIILGFSTEEEASLFNLQWSGK